MVRQAFADRVGADAMTEGGLEPWLRVAAPLRSLGLEGFGIRALLAHGNPSEMGDRAR